MKNLHRRGKIGLLRARKKIGLGFLDGSDKATAGITLTDFSCLPRFVTALGLRGLKRKVLATKTGHDILGREDKQKKKNDFGRQKSHKIINSSYILQNFSFTDNIKMAPVD